MPTVRALFPSALTLALGSLVGCRESCSRDSRDVRIGPDDAGSSTPSPPPAPAPRLPADGPIVLSSEWTRCKLDADCVILTLGCCNETAVARPHAAEVRKALDASGRSYCPPKTACGPGPDGTWNDQPATCGDGTCQLPAALVPK